MRKRENIEAIVDQLRDGDVSADLNRTNAMQDLQLEVLLDIRDTLVTIKEKYDNQ